MYIHPPPRTERKFKRERDRAQPTSSCPSSRVELNTDPFLPRSSSSLMAPLLVLRSSPLLRASTNLSSLLSSTTMPRHPSASARGRGSKPGGGGAGRAHPPPPPPPARSGPKHKRFFSHSRPKRQESGPTFMTFNVDGLKKASSGSAGEPVRPSTSSETSRAELELTQSLPLGQRRPSSGPSSPVSNPPTS